MMADDELQASAEKRARRPGAVGIMLSGLAAGAFFAAGATLVETVVARFSGSYIDGEVVLIVLAWWTCAGALAGLVTGLAALPVVLFLKGKARGAVVPALVIALGFFAYSANVRGNLLERDPLIGGVILHPVFLASWGVVLGALLIALAVRCRWSVTRGLYVVGAASILVSAGAAHFSPKVQAAYILVVGAPALLSINAWFLEKAQSRKVRAALPLAFTAVCAALLVVVASVGGELSHHPIDRGSRPGADQVSLLAGKPNVIIVTLDTARADRMSLCGYEYPTTPYLDKMASDCRFFPNGVSVNSWTLPSHASLFTGKYSRGHGAHGHSSSKTRSSDKSLLSGIPLHGSQTTLASILSERGYNTAAFVANYIWLGREFGLQQGFNYYHDLPRFLVFLESGTPLYKCGLAAADKLLGRNGKLLQGYYSGRAVSEFAETWVGTNADTPFFLFLNYMDPHETYAPPGGFDKLHGDVAYNDMIADQPAWQKYHDDYIEKGGLIEPDLLEQISNQYDGEIAYADCWLGGFIESLKRLGIYDNTLIVITCDHGEFFGEHQLLNHGVGIYEGGVRIPILVKYPGREFAGEVISDRVSIADVFATVLDVLNLPLPEVTAQPLGSVTHPILVEDYENATNIRRYGKKFRRSQTAIYSEDWKYTHRSGGRHQLVNLKDDPGETTNLVAARPDVAKTLAAEIAEWQAQTPEFDGTKDIDMRMKRETREKLTVGGYF